MSNSNRPLRLFIEALKRLRDFLKGLTPEEQLATASGVAHPYSLHNFLALKMSFFPGDDDSLIQMAEKAMPTGVIPAASELATAKTVRNFLEFLIDPSFNESCGAVYNSDDPQGAQGQNISEFAAELDDIQRGFEDVLEAAEWPNRANLWTSLDMTVANVIQAGTK